MCCNPHTLMRQCFKDALLVCGVEYGVLSISNPDLCRSQFTVPNLKPQPHVPSVCQGPHRGI